MHAVRSAITATAELLVRCHAMQATTSFQVDQQSGAIVVSSSLDYEVSPNYMLAVMASDCPSDGPALMTYASVVVHVLDVNDNPPMIAITTLQTRDVKTILLCLLLINTF